LKDNQADQAADDADQHFRVEKVVEPLAECLWLF
jgi:hypothetical protein